MTLAQAAKSVRRKRWAMKVAAARASLDIGALAHKEAIRLSSGVVPTVMLSAPVARKFKPKYRRGRWYFSTGAGHPYGHGATGAAGPRGPIPYGNPAVINSQDGTFRSHWKVTQSIRGGFRLENDAFQARWLLEGTPLMRDRPILKEIGNNAVRPRARGTMIAALEAAWKNG